VHHPHPQQTPTMPCAYKSLKRTHSSLSQSPTPPPRRRQNARGSSSKALRRQSLVASCLSRRGCRLVRPWRMRQTMRGRARGESRARGERREQRIPQRTRLGSRRGRQAHSPSLPPPHPVSFRGTSYRLLPREIRRTARWCQHPHRAHAQRAAAASGKDARGSAPAQRCSEPAPASQPLPS